MELKDILSAYIERKGYKATGNLSSLDILMPTLLIDVCYTTYETHLSGQKFIHAEKRYSNILSKHINVYFRDFWRLWSEEEMAYIVDWMDEFRAYVNTHLEILLNVLWRHFEKFGDLHRFVMSNVMLCNILSQAANMVQAHIYGRKDDNISKIVFASQELLFAVGDRIKTERSTVDLNKYKDINDAVVAFVNRLRDFRQNNQ